MLCCAALRLRTDGTDACLLLIFLLFSSSAVQAARKTCVGRQALPAHHREHLAVVTNGVNEFARVGAVLQPTLTVPADVVAGAVCSCRTIARPFCSAIRAPRLNDSRVQQQASNDSAVLRRALLPVLVSRPSR